MQELKKKTPNKQVLYIYTVYVCIYTDCSPPPRTSSQFSRQKTMNQVMG